MRNWKGPNTTPRKRQSTRPQRQKATGKEVPAGMQDVWDWQHKQITAKYAGIKALLEMAKKP